MALALLNGIGACTVDNSDPGVRGMCLADDGVTSIPCSLIRECDGTQASTNQHFEYQIGQSTGNVNINVVDPSTGEILGHEDQNSNFVPGVIVNSPAVGWKAPLQVVNQNQPTNVSPQMKYDPITGTVVPISVPVLNVPNASVYKWGGGYWTMPAPKEYTDNPTNFIAINAVSTDKNNPRTSYSLPKAVVINTNVATQQSNVPTTNTNSGSNGGDDWITSLIKKFSPTTQLRTNMPSVVATSPIPSISGLHLNPTYVAIGAVGLIGLYVYSQSGATARGRY